MNWDRVEGNWKQVKGAVKARWGKLTDDDFDVIAGKREQLAGRIQEAYGITKEELIQRLTQDRDLWVDRKGRLFFTCSGTVAWNRTAVVCCRPR